MALWKKIYESKSIIPREFKSQTVNILLLDHTSMSTEDFRIDRREIAEDQRPELRWQYTCTKLEHLLQRRNPKYKDQPSNSEKLVCLREAVKDGPANSIIERPSKSAENVL